MFGHAALADYPLTATAQSERPDDVSATTPPTDKLSAQDRISLHLDDVEVRKALELLSREGSLNILVSPGVSGRVTANIQNMLPDEALVAILKMTRLTATRERGLIYVYAAQEMAEMNDSARLTGTRVYPLNYIRGVDLQAMITPFLSTDVGKVAVTPASAVGIPSHSDNVGGDSLAGSDTVIVQDYESVLVKIDELVQRLDVRPIQVVIEAVIMEVLLRDGKELGVNFGVLDGAGRALTVLGNGGELNVAAGFRPNEVLVAGAAVAPGTMGNVKGSSTDGFAADTHGIKFGFSERDVTGFIRALEQCGETRILATPRLLVLNKQRAELIIGDRIGYKTQTVTETASIEKVEFLNVGTQLRLRPFVANDGMIRMEIHPERSSGEVDRETGLPRSSTSEVTTNIIVPDSATIVIAGLLQTEDITLQSGVPFLSRLRWIGPLFRQRTDSRVKKELVVLLTPHIWNQCTPTDTMEDLHLPASHKNDKPSVPLSGSLVPGKLYDRMTKPRAPVAAGHVPTPRPRIADPFVIQPWHDRSQSPAASQAEPNVAVPAQAQPAGLTLIEK